MPFVSARSSDDAPPGFDWGSPSGRLIHIQGGSSHAVYVIEKEPEVAPINMSVSSGIHQHLIPFPWRYYFIRAHWSSRVCGANPGFVFFARKKVSGLDDKSLLRACMPNTFVTGHMCLGYSVSFRGRSPIRSAWATIRYFENSPFNGIVGVGSGLSPNTSTLEIPKACSFHKGSWIAAYCSWSTIDIEKSLQMNYVDLGLSIRDVLGKNFIRQQYRIRDEVSV